MSEITSMGMFTSAGCLFFSIYANSKPRKDKKFDFFRSKKISGIRTLLIIPELDVEEQIWKSEIGRIYQLAQLQEVTREFSNR